MTLSSACMPPDGGQVLPFLDLVPGDDRDIVIPFLQKDGVTPLPLNNATAETAKVTWPGGSFDVTLNMSDAANGNVGVSFARTDTAKWLDADGNAKPITPRLTLAFLENTGTKRVTRYAAKIRLVATVSTSVPKVLTPGTQGVAARIASVNANMVAHTETAAVAMTGSDTARVFTFEIPQGPPGAAANITTVTTQTLAYTAPATASLSGSQDDLTLTLGIPAGPPDTSLNQSNVIVGDEGAAPSNGETVTRPTWDAITNPPAAVSSFDLDLTGHYVKTGLTSAIIVGGQTAYFNSVRSTAQLSFTWGGDNLNEQLAGMIFAKHADLIKDDLGVGDHSGIFGGSFHQIGGSYNASVGGQFTQIFANYSINIGGRNNKIGDKADSSAHTRCINIGGRFNWVLGEENFNIGGFQNRTTINAQRSGTIGGQDNIAEADRALVLGGQGGVADLINALVTSPGPFAVAGDNQTYDFVCKEDSPSSTVAAELSLNGGSGVHIIEPPANSVGMLHANIVAARTDVVGETAAFFVTASWSTTSGSLVIKSQTVTALHEDDAGYNVLVLGRSGNTKVSLRGVDPGNREVRWSGGGKLTVLHAV